MNTINDLLEDLLWVCSSLQNHPEKWNEAAIVELQPIIDELFNITALVEGEESVL